MIVDFFSSAGSTITKNIMKLMCAPYTIPLGIINQYVLPIDTCYSSIKQDMSLDAKTKENTIASGSLGTKQPDLNNVSEFSNVNRNVMRVLDNERQVSSINITSHNLAEINCPFHEREGDDDNTNFMETDALTRKYNNRDIPVYHCCPNVDQQSTIEISEFNQLSKQKINEIANEINIHVENTLKETGVGEVNMDAGVRSSNEIQNDVYKNINNKILQASHQNLNIKQGLEYIDRYGMCDPTTMDANGNVRGKTLKQAIDVKSLSMNIIDTSVGIIMENNTEIKSKTEVRVNRVGNYRLLIVSFLWNIVMVYLLFLIIKKFVQRIRGY